MKKIVASGAFALAVAALAVGCSKKKSENAINCVGQGLLLTVQATADGANSKKINFEARYSGELTVSSVVWEFGDGSTETVSSKTASHTYANTGTYPVKAKVTLSKGSSSCTSDHNKSVTVN